MLGCTTSTHSSIVLLDVCFAILYTSTVSIVRFIVFVLGTVFLNKWAWSDPLIQPYLFGHVLLKVTKIFGSLNDSLKKDI